MFGLNCRFMQQQNVVNILSLVLYSILVKFWSSLYWINPNTNWSLFITGAGDSAEFAVTELFALQPV
jgi:hypothetical protein